MLLLPSVLNTITIATMMASNWVGSVGVFDPFRRFSVYVERVHLLSLANDIKGERQVVTFLSILGAKSLYCATFWHRSLRIPKERWEELVSTLENHSVGNCSKVLFLLSANEVATLLHLRSGTKASIH